MKIAIVHDYLNQLGGAERVLLKLKDLFGDKVPIYTLLGDNDIIKKMKLNNVKACVSNIKFDHRYILPLFPVLINFINLKKYDLILSDSHAWVKNLKRPKNSLHICYCYTPIRYAWDLKEIYLKKETKLIRPLVRLFLSWVRWWDYKNTKNVDYFIAISKNVQDRVKKYYGRNAVIIYPPVDTKFYKPSKDIINENFYLVVSRLINNKGVDVIIKAFNKLGKKLIIIGTGREGESFKKIAKDNIKFLGWMSDKETLKYYQRCQAFIFCGYGEDFGLTPVEAQACGKPVIAFGEGGVLETVIEGKTGHLFYKPTPEAIINAVEEFEKMRFNARICRKNALKFDTEIFKRKIKRFIEEKYKEFKDGKKEASAHGSNKL